jgi:hypothetical protein
VEDTYQQSLWWLSGGHRANQERRPARLASGLVAAAPAQRAACNKSVKWIPSRSFCFIIL